MVLCFAAFCNHQSIRDTCSFFRFPKNKYEKSLWTIFSRRKDRGPVPDSRLCSCHFKDGLKENGPIKEPKPKIKVVPKATHTKCVVNGCTKGPGKRIVRNFRIPQQDKERMEKWIKAIGRTPTENSRVCGRHFQTGQPNKDPSHPDYVPNLFVFGGTDGNPAAPGKRLPVGVYFKTVTNLNNGKENAEKLLRSMQHNPVGLSAELAFHNCHTCEKCLNCHYCLLVDVCLPEDLRKATTEQPPTKPDDPKCEMNAIVNDFIKEYYEDEPPRFILVGPNNEIFEKIWNDADSGDSIHDNTITDADNSDSDTISAPGSIGEYQKEIEVNGNEISVDEGPQIYKCTPCQKTFTSEKDMNIHKIYHSSEKSLKCKICDKTFSYSYELIKHSIFHARLPHLCEICKKSFPNRRSFQTHSKIHLGAKTITSSEKKSTTSNSQQLKKTGTKSLLTINSKKTIDKRPALCNECGKRFRDKALLRRHELTHSGIKPYKCVLCEKKYRSNYDLRIHLRKYHKISHSLVF